MVEAAPTRDALRRALARARDGKPLDAAEAETLLHARGDDLAELMAHARRVADAGHGRTITYSRKVFIPVTRLCRDRCHYCTFATSPAHLPAPYLSRDEVVAIARAGQEQGCKEALLTLGDRPEDRWPQAREWLDAHGYASTVDYVRACAIAVLEETGLLPHVNAGVLSWEELARLKPVSPSMGLMLETTAERLFTTPGAVHHGSPDKAPAVRLRVLDDAGRLAIPFTTGLLLGIGETYAERVETLLAIRRASQTYGAVQEVIVQSFRAKDDTAMRGADEPSLDDDLATIAVARLLLGPAAHVQAPPNLDRGEHVALVMAGVDDLGGISPITPDHVNPELAWPDIAELTKLLADSGFALRERLAVHPRWQGEPWLDARVVGHVQALADEAGLAREGQCPTPRPWQEPDAVVGTGAGGSGAVDLDARLVLDAAVQRTELRDDAVAVYGDLDAVGAMVSAEARSRGSAATVPAPRSTRMRDDVRAALRRAQDHPGRLSDAEYLALLDAQEGVELDALAALADDVRRDAVGDVVTYVVNRNVNFTNVCYTGCRFCAFAQRRSDSDAYTLSLAEVGDRVAEAWEVGATEVCMQGGIHPDLPGSAYAELAREVKRRAPAIHLHAFSPMEVVNAATRTGRSISDVLTELREAGVDSLPGTAAEILDDDVRWILTKGKLPAASWVEVITTAHRLGLRTTATMMYGHVDEPRHWVAHLRVLRGIQDETGGFTELVPLPFVHRNAPIYLAGIARPGPTAQENRAVHAVARLLLHGSIDHLQASWVKLGPAGVQQLLRGGVDDLGGTLMEETISRMAGSEHGARLDVAELVAIGAEIGRPVRQRTTSYGEVPAERLAAQARQANAPVPAGEPSPTRRALPLLPLR